MGKIAIPEKQAEKLDLPARGALSPLRKMLLRVAANEYYQNAEKDLARPSYFDRDLGRSQ